MVQGCVTVRLQMNGAGMFKFPLKFEWSGIQISRLCEKNTKISYFIGFIYIYKYIYNSIYIKNIIFFQNLTMYYNSVTKNEQM